jgi:uncharacterized protein (TIGR02594 family)
LELELGLNITAYDLALRFVGMREVPGSGSNPAILSILRLDQEWPEVDEVPWCSAFVNYVAWLLRLPRSKSLRARSWLQVGVPTPLLAATVGFDVVILARGQQQAGPEVINAPGHVGFYAGAESGHVLLLGGNQGDAVSIAPFDTNRLLGVRRLLV